VTGDPGNSVESDAATSGSAGSAPSRRVDLDSFRDALGRFATGITVVTTRTPDGVDHAMTANAFTSVSIDPFLVLVCVEKIARFHDAVLETGLWGVSVLGERAVEASNWFATRGRPLENQLAGFPYTRGPATGAALFSDALATVECRTTGIYEGGDHDIVVGEVLSLAVPRPDDRPLLYFQGKYHIVGDAT
jgi:flavin reductase (DIM6/NTAB) family NADH-FMN oxidoreductase RutF